MTGTRWIFAIVGFLGAGVCASVALAILAHHGASAVIPAYDTRALEYDHVLDQDARDRALGWVVSVGVERERVEVGVRDAAGGALSGARVHVRGYHRAYAADTHEVDLTGEGGHYGGAFATHAGWHDLVVTIDHGDEHYERAFAVEAR